MHVMFGFLAKQKEAQQEDTNTNNLKTACASNPNPNSKSGAPQAAGAVGTLVVGGALKAPVRATCADRPALHFRLAARLVLAHVDRPELRARGARVVQRARPIALRHQGLRVALQLGASQQRPAQPRRAAGAPCSARGHRGCRGGPRRGRDRRRGAGREHGLGRRRGDRGPRPAEQRHGVEEPRGWCRPLGPRTVVPGAARHAALPPSPTRPRAYAHAQPCPRSMCACEPCPKLACVHPGGRRWHRGLPPLRAPVGGERAAVGGLAEKCYVGARSRWCQSDSLTRCQNVYRSAWHGVCEPPFVCVSVCGVPGWRRCGAS